MNKKIISGLLALAVVFGGAAVIPANAVFFDTAITASAENATEDFEWKVIDDENIMVTGYKGTEKDVVIPSKALNRTVSAIGDGAFKGKDITSVTCPETINKINDEAFKNCKSLKTLKLPSNAEFLGAGVCRDCKALETVNIPDGIDNINNSAFLNCSTLQEVTIPASVKEISFYAFENCTSLKKVTFNKGLKLINQEAFKNCTSLTSVTLPEGLTEMENAAFANCTSLTDVVLPNTLTTIWTQSMFFEDGAFAGCTALKSITLPSSLETLGSCTFFNCTELSEVIINGEGLKEIEAGAFAKCPALKEITLPKSAKLFNRLGDCGLFYTSDEEGNEVLKTDFVLNCYKNSKAEEYAIACGMLNIKYLPELPEFKKGDIDGDGAVIVKDISKLAAHIKGKKELTGDELVRADVNGDGEVNVKDLSLVAAHVKGIRALE